MPAEIQLLPCGYPARSSMHEGQARATTLVRYTDNQSRPLRQWELCDRHANWPRANGKNVREMQGDSLDQLGVEKIESGECKAKKTRETQSDTAATQPLEAARLVLLRIVRTISQRIGFPMGARDRIMFGVVRFEVQIALQPTSEHQFDSDSRSCLD
jgi:hypothetical protein